jgi:pyruvate/2-oxoglutarate dehydrogenase complex dihydrolipoamide dehydrogenase (E3) component
MTESYDVIIIGSGVGCAHQAGTALRVGDHLLSRMR